MSKIKVLIVDDSAFMRKVLEDILKSDDEIEVVATAKDGKEAFELVKKLEPNVITMDVEMPIMNGIDATKQIMAYKPTPILMLSAVTKQGSEATLKALDNGAVDFIEKPSGSVSLDIRKIGEKIIKQVKNASKSKVRIKSSRILETIKKEKQAESSTPKPQVEKTSGLSPEKLNDTAILIGSSTGGPPVVSSIISNIPKNTPPIFIVQHMPKGFTRVFAERMNNNSAITVKEAEHGEIVKPDHAYVAPGDSQMVLQKRGGNVYIIIDENMPKIHGTKPTVDVTAEYVTKYYGKNTIGVLLTGIGRDGANGLKMVKNKGGYTIAQNQDTCVIYGMPKTAIEMNVVDKVMDPIDIPLEIIKFAKKIGG
ncbi:protein-glutamate methylesterase/protein-glutamine glutaminase [Methanococcus maripaludis]|uniref:Protein-glutamate methylesterase/protein-glutamine glutaminase n=1 Tax=Methanococcus maripaludis TaxID=39152 RepID=A0A2L1C813_METMI|nr:chemotaxis response regulator protein-glutamate methylesterase [Methanococcus maripaludis]AVB75484.1 Chemotaxis response regulator protein-glutamate methylesterase [Methanococcus maripaludis]MBA2863809.1 two-component system chemotaxis response regulator CheB [Methanococcus maripaludis]MBB6496185.1 two-component system chemotaxis response regulator CheB [Methanococcus maripaludis]